MAPLSSTFSLVLSICCAVSFKSTVLGDCSFPATYTNRFWFRMYSDGSFQKYIYRLFTANVADNQNDNAAAFSNQYPCSSIVVDSTDSNTLYYLYDNYGIQTCAKSVLTSDTSAILLQEVDVPSTITGASQCSSFFTTSCTKCGSIWMSVVSDLSQPPRFGSSTLCPFPGLFQMTASLNGSSPECSADTQSTAMFYGFNLQMNLCGQGTLRNATFKSKTLLQDPLTCMASLDGKALNSNEAGSTIVLLRDSNALYCARFKNVTGGLELSINVKNDFFAGCSFNASSNPVLQLTLTPITSTPGISTTTTPLSTSPGSPTPVSITTTLPQTSTTTSTTASTSASTSTGASISTSTGTSTTTSTTTTPSTSISIGTSKTTTFPITTTTTTTMEPTTTTTTTTPSPTTPAPITTTLPTTTTTTPTTTTTTTSTSSWVTPGPISTTSPGIPTTTSAVSKGPPVNVEGPTDNCPSTACATSATCNEATHNCSCQSVFYAYSRTNSSSRCIQDDLSIDDTFLKIVVPIIAIAAAGSLIAALALCFATQTPDALALDGAALAAASADGGGGGAQAAVGPGVRPGMALPQENPVFVSYGRNDTYANVDTIDRTLVTYGDQPNVAPPVPPSNYVMVGSSIPAKM